jgi:aminopeptidase N
MYPRTPARLRKLNASWSGCLAARPEQSQRLVPLCAALAGALFAAGAQAAPAIATPNAQQPFDFDRTPGRLPKLIVPQSYRIAITPYPERLTLAGSELIVLQFRAATATVVFNSLNQTLRDVRLDGKPVQSVRSDNRAQLTTVQLTAAAPPGLHRLTLTYQGRIETRAVGLFVQHYAKPRGGQGLLLSTQMEPADARRMFPCWDEPAFRASFQLSVTVPADWATVSNMPRVSRVVHGAQATTIFGRSPRMPSYLVELTAGDLRSINAWQDGIRLGVWGVTGRERDGAAALANARQILTDYNRYFGYRYPLPKLDSIAIPGGFSGGMENWGAITYTEDALLVPSAATLAQRQDVFSLEAHEIAHQWTGDLVTMGWWNDLWLNESFASWMAAKETAVRNPTWKWWEVQDADKEEAMRADAQPASRAIEQPVADERQADDAFDPAITYSKGQAVLRMLENYLGADVFRDGMRRYIRARAFSNATASDLWRALSAASGRDVTALAAPWTEQAGFPLVTASARCDSSGHRTLTLSQQRFLVHGHDAREAHWSVPLRVRIGALGTPSTLVLPAAGDSIAAGDCAQPVSLNADAIGFYRVRYDADTLATDTRSFAQLPDGDRIALLDDQWALVAAGEAPLPSYLALAAAMGNDLDSRAWDQIATALDTVVDALRGTSTAPAFTAYARSLIHPAAERLGWNVSARETPDLQRLRRTLLRDLGTWGDGAVVAEARRRFDAFLKDPRAIRSDDLRMILTLAAEDADAATFDRLHALAQQARDGPERRVRYAALMQVRAPPLAERAAQIALSSEIPPEEAQLRLELIAELAHEHPQLAWQTFSAHASALLAPFGAYAPLMTADEVPRIFWNSAPPEQLESWIRAHVGAEMAPEIAHSMESVRFRVSRSAALQASAAAFMRARAPS